MQPSQTAGALGAFRQQTRVFDATANNLSNSQTVGFKKDVTVFRNLLSQSNNRHRNLDGDGDETVTSFAQGPMQHTGNPLDLAVEGEGFFKLDTPNGPRYTRAGNFKLDKDRRLVSANGYPVVGSQGEVMIRGTHVVVEQDGTIRVDGQEAGKITPVRIPDPGLLKKEEHTLFRLEGDDAELQAEEARVLQGTLEMSNADPVQEMVKLIESLRSYESCLKLVQSNDEMDGKAVNELGRV
jgi:flagellar basal-body rod protein FlgF